MLGERLRKASLQKGMKLRELCEKSGYSVSRLSNYEQNRAEPSIDVINKLAGILGVRAAELLEPEESPPTGIDDRLLGIIESQQNMLSSQQEVIKKLIDKLQ